ncbi:MAG: DinB family protein [Anaerolineae bacterium]|nr:DinB family protein [Anaerolineae bacterium]
MVQDIFQWSKAILSSTAARWRQIIDAYPHELLLISPAPGEWSALECLQHLAEVEQVSTSVRLKSFLAGEPFPGFSPDDSAKEPPTLAVLAEFARLRAENLLLLDQFTVADLEKAVHHAEYGMVTLSQFLHHLAAHDLMHTVQAEQAMMQPFIQGCGPWEINYEAHIAQA